MLAELESMAAWTTIVGWWAKVRSRKKALCIQTRTLTSGLKPWDGFCSQATGRNCAKKTDAMIREVVAIQEPNGYLNTYYVGDRKPERMDPTQEEGHELYNIGHMIQGAIAYYRATGDPTLLMPEANLSMVSLIPNYGPGGTRSRSFLDIRRLRWP